jgi:hypothetical protein
MLLIAGHSAKDATPQDTSTVTTPDQSSTPNKGKKEKSPYKAEWLVLNVKKEIPLKKILKNPHALSMKNKIKIAMDIMAQIANSGEGKIARKSFGAEGIVVRFGTNLKNQKMVDGLVKELYVPATTPNTPPPAIAVKKPHTIRPRTEFIPPAIAYKGKISPKEIPSTDVFSLGCTFWQMYFGKEPVWIKLNKEKAKGSKKERLRREEFFINLVRSSKQRDLPKKKFSAKKKFLRTILKMTDPSAAGRGSSGVAYAMLYDAYTGHPLPQPKPEKKKVKKADSKSKKKPAAKK